MQIKLKTLFDKEAQVNSEMIYSFRRDPYLSEGLHDIKIAFLTGLLTE